MIAFRGLRVGGGAPAMSGHRQAQLTPSGGREKRPSGRPCRLLRSPRAVLVMDRITAGHAPGLKNLQGRQMCHPSMKVSTRLYPAGSGRHSGIVRPCAISPAATERRVFT